MSSRPPVPTLLALAAAALLAGCDGEAAEAPPPPPAEVTVVTLHEEPVTLDRVLPGRTQAFLVAEVRPQVNGIVTARLFEEGAAVRRGEPLYQLDDAVYRAEHANALAALAKAEARVAATEITARRTGELRQIDAVSAQEHDDAVAALRAAEADVAAARAAVERRRIDLGYSRITSPIAGRIGKSAVTTGALVTANQAQPLATVQQLDPIYVDLSQSSSEWLGLRQAMAGLALGDRETPVTILLEDGTTHSHPGKLQFADVTVDEGTGSFGLRVIVPNPEGILRPGMYVRAVLPVGAPAPGLLVPQQALSRDPKGDATVFVVGPAGEVEQRRVVASRTVGDQWLVDEGLAAGERVVVEGLQRVSPGATVTAVERQAPSAAEESTPPATVSPAAG